MRRNGGGQGGHQAKYKRFRFLLSLRFCLSFFCFAMLRVICRVYMVPHACANVLCTVAPVYQQMHEGTRLMQAYPRACAQRRGVETPSAISLLRRSRNKRTRKHKERGRSRRRAAAPRRRNHRLQTRCSIASALHSLAC